MIRRRTLLAVVAAVAAVALFAAPATAAPKSKPGLSGTIEVAESGGELRASTTGMTYGDRVAFDTTVTGQVDRNASVYVTVVCTQGDVVVYQWSGGLSFDFPLLDQTGQGLEWDGGDADCSGSLMYRVEKGKRAQISILDETTFAVAGA